MTAKRPVWKEDDVRRLQLLADAKVSAETIAKTLDRSVAAVKLQVKPFAPMGCKLVGTVKGTKLWAGDCVGSKLKGAAPAEETQSLPKRAIEVIPPGQKQ